MDASLLAEAQSYALTGGGAGMITRNGRRVASWGNLETRYDIKSTTKSIGMTAAGLAIADGLIDFSDKAQVHLATFGVPPDSNAATGWLDDITLLQLATHTAGFDKQGGFVPLLHAPGTTWDYSDGGLNWLADVLTQVYGEDLNSLLFRRVFSRMGIDSTDLVWRSNFYRGDTINGVKRREFGSGIKVNVDAMARIGYLYLRNGVWDGDQLLPASFVNLVGRPSPAVVGLPVDEPAKFPQASSHYGVGWFTNADGTIPEVPTDAYWGWGLLDSLIVVIPSLDVVAVRAGTGLGRTGWNADYSFIAPFLTPIARSVASIAVPDVVGLSQSAAQTAIATAGLAVGAILSASSGSVPVGRVISQNPDAGSSVSPGTSVALVISTGVGSVTVPGVVGLAQAAAQDAIVAAGLAVGAIVETSSESVPAGRVISQDPGGGASVAPGSNVALVVSTGSGAVTVPDVMGQMQAAAESAIVDARLVVGPVETAVSGSVPAGRVISQNPEAGSSVGAGSSVALVVSIGPTAVTVPDVVGLTQTAAETAIGEAGLAVGPISNASSATVPAGRVISQEPEGGASAAPGASIALIVSTGPVTVTVPDVIGLARAAAESAIEGAGFVVGPVSMVSSDTVPDNHVISQDPDGNEIAAPGASVSLVVSTGPASVNRHLEFDGGNDRILVPSTDSLRRSNAVTVEAWIRPRTVATGTAQDRVLKKGNNYELHISTGDTACASGTSGHVQWRATIAGVNKRICGGGLTPGHWHHVAGTYNGTNFSLYLDGIRVASITRSGAMALGTTPLVIGNNDAGARGFDGAIDAVAVWTRALTATEIAARINQAPSGGASGLAAYWSFDEASGQSAFDATTNANHGILGLNGGVDSADPARAQ